MCIGFSYKDDACTLRNFYFTQIILAYDVLYTNDIN